MSNEDVPQLEDGYTRIANELFEAILGFGFTQRQLSVVLTVIRKTYGYGKKQDDMSAAQIGLICDMERNHVTEVIGQLVQMNVLTRATGTYGLVLGINKSHSKWKEKERASPKLGLSEVVPNRDKSSPKLGQVDSPKLGHTKENLSKETQKKGSRSEKTFDSWIAACKESGLKPIPEDDAVFKYATEVDLPMDYIRFSWLEFKRKYTGNSKKYKNWNQHFQNAVRENWYGIWFEKEGGWTLTTRGKQIEKEARGKE